MTIGRAVKLQRLHSLSMVTYVNARNHIGPRFGRGHREGLDRSSPMFGGTGLTVDHGIDPVGSRNKDEPINFC